LRGRGERGSCGGDALREVRDCKVVIIAVLEGSCD
jgi:hypothetical protein